MKRFCCFISIIVLWCTGPLSAHELRPAYLEIKEVSSGEYDVLWKVPIDSTGSPLDLRLRFSEGVKQSGEDVSGYTGGAYVRRFLLASEVGLAGQSVYIDGLEKSMTDVLCRVESADGGVLVHRLTPDSKHYAFASEPSTLEVFWLYLALGFEHIIMGVDHLLFVLALLLIVRSAKVLLGTITAFTLAHSITLALSTLGVVAIPSAPVEATIALSIVFVASECVQSRRGMDGLTARAPWIVSFSFGLLHGFGFAGALTEIGLPQQSIPMALLSFNIGVELGQIGFVVVCLASYYLVKMVPLRKTEWTGYALPYAIGSLAFFWVIERAVNICG